MPALRRPDPTARHLDLERRVRAEPVVGDLRRELGCGDAQRRSGLRAAQQPLCQWVDVDDPEQRLVGQLDHAVRRHADRLPGGDVAACVGRGRVRSGIRIGPGAGRHQCQRGLGPPRHVVGELAHVVEDLGQRRPLLHVAVGADGNRAGRHLLRTEARQHDDPGRRAEPTDRRQRLDAVHHGHREVEQDDVRALLAHDLDALAAVACLADDVEAALGQRQAEEVPKVAGVVDDHDATGAGVGQGGHVVRLLLDGDAALPRSTTAGALRSSSMLKCSLPSRFVMIRLRVDRGGERGVGLGRVVEVEGHLRDHQPLQHAVVELSACCSACAGPRRAGPPA